LDQKRMIERLKENPAALQAIARSPDGQALMRLLQGRDGGQRLQQAASQAAAGSTAQLLQMLQSIMATPGGAELIRRIGQDLQK